jgi:hypothetical protein
MFQSSFSCSKNSMVRSQRNEVLKDLPTRVRVFAHCLRIDFASDIERNAGEFKRRVIRLFKAELHPKPGRPRTEHVTRASEMRRQGKTWQQVYAECLRHVIGTSDSRQLAQYRLRCAVRSRCKTRRRKKSVPKSRRERMQALDANRF